MHAPHNDNTPKFCSGIPDVLEKYKGEAFTCEYKYDGQRAQIHLLPDGEQAVCK